MQTASRNTSSLSLTGEIAEDDRDDHTAGLDNILDPTEIRRLLEAASPGFDRTLFLTAFVTGAREGELLALRWTDLELTKEGPGKMAIRRSLSWARLKGEEIRPRFFPPKTKAGRRVIQIPDELVAALKLWKLQCPKSNEELVFPMPEGRRSAAIGSCGRVSTPRSLAHACAE